MLTHRPKLILVSLLLVAGCAMVPSIVRAQTTPSNASSTLANNPTIDGYDQHHPAPSATAPEVTPNWYWWLIPAALISLAAYLLYRQYHQANTITNDHQTHDAYFLDHVNFWGLKGGEATGMQHYSSNPHEQQLAEYERQLREVYESEDDEFQTRH